MSRCGKKAAAAARPRIANYKSTYKAAYPLVDGTTTDAPQCSGSTDFCFLCEYSEGVAGDADVVGELKTLAKALASEGKEVPVIVAALQDAYNETARDLVEWTAPNGTVVERPEWTVASINRHILFSTELNVFGNAVDQILHSVIYTLNNTLVDISTGLIIEEHRKALMDTIKTRAMWGSRGKTSR